MAQAKKTYRVNRDAWNMIVRSAGTSSTKIGQAYGKSASYVSVGLQCGRFPADFVEWVEKTYGWKRERFTMPEVPADETVEETINRLNREVEEKANALAAEAEAKALSKIEQKPQRIQVVKARANSVTTKTALSDQTIADISARVSAAVVAVVKEHERPNVQLFSEGTGYDPKTLRNVFIFLSKHHEFLTRIENGESPYTLLADYIVATAEA